MSDQQVKENIFLCNNQESFGVNEYQKSIQSHDKPQITTPHVTKLTRNASYSGNRSGLTPLTNNLEDMCVLKTPQNKWHSKSLPHHRQQQQHSQQQQQPPPLIAQKHIPYQPPKLDFSTQSPMPSPNPGAQATIDGYPLKPPPGGVYQPQQTNQAQPFQTITSNSNRFHHQHQPRHHFQHQTINSHYQNTHNQHYRQNNFTGSQKRPQHKRKGDSQQFSNNRSSEANSHMKKKVTMHRFLNCTMINLAFDVNNDIDHQEDDKQLPMVLHQNYHAQLLRDETTRVDAYQLMPIHHEANPSKHMTDNTETENLSVNEYSEVDEALKFSKHMDMLHTQASNVVDEHASYVKQLAIMEFETRQKSSMRDK